LDVVSIDFVCVCTRQIDLVNKERKKVMRWGDGARETFDAKEKRQRDSKEKKQKKTKKDFLILFRIIPKISVR
jgi:hypothetical protein